MSPLTARQMPSTSSSRTPFDSAAVAAAWITGPSASGSENGTPSSSTSPPATAAARAASRDVSTSGKPPIRYGISAARLPLASAKAADSWSLIEREDLGQILVAAAGERHQVERRLRVLHEPGQRVGRLERGHDALQAGDLLERGDRLGVGDRVVDHATLVAQPRVLGPGARVVEAGRHRVGFEHLAVVVLQHGGQRAGRDAAGARGQRGAVAAGVEPVAARLDADQPDLAVVEET